LDVFDPDLFLDVVSGGRLEHFLLAPAQCDANLLHWDCGGVSVDVGDYSFPVRVVGSFTRDRFCIGYMRRTSTPTWVNGFDVEQHTIQFYPAGSELNYRADANGEWVAIEIEEEVFQTAANRHLGRHLELSTDRTRSFRMARSHRQALDRAVCELVRKTAVDPGDLEAFLSLLADILVHAQHDDVDALARKWSARLELLHRSDAYLRHSDATPFDLNAMAKATGTSRRSLQRHFASAYGMTPQRWARCFRLHQARNRLRASIGQGVSVEEIARDCGFRHMGRFAGYYRELFGESPSETMAQ